MESSLINWLGLGRLGGLVLLSGVGGGVKEVFIGGHLKFGHFQIIHAMKDVNFDSVCGQLFCLLALTERYIGYKVSPRIGSVSLT